MTSRRHRDPRAWTPPPAENGTDDELPPPPPPPPAGREAPPAGAGWAAPPWAPDAWPARTSSPPPPPPAPDDGWVPRPAPWSPSIPPPPPDDDWEPQPVTPWAPTAPPDPPVPPGARPGGPLADPWAAPGAEHDDPWSAAGAPGPGRSQTSPAYSSPLSAAYAPDRPSPPPLVETPGAEKRRRRWLVPAIALVVVAALAAGAFVVLGGGDGDDGYAFGTVATATGDATVRTGGGDARPLEEGETVEAGWVIEAAGDAAVTLELAGGGVVRADSGATLSFVDLAERSGEDGEPTPAIELAGGRSWLNPVNDAASSAVALRIPEATVVTTGNPVAVDCTQACSVEAPAGGVTLTTNADLDASPAPNEVVTVRGADALELVTGTAPSAWAGQNLDADIEDGLPQPTPVESTGVKGTAVANGAYSLNLVVDGNPTGDPIPSELTFILGQTYTVDLVVDASGCVTVPCDVPVMANDGATGSARIEGGTVNVSFTQPIDCYDETMTTVVVPGIGTTAVQASLRITDVALAGDRWEATQLDGSGTVAATLATPCNPGETLGTSTSTMVLRGPRAG
jgi:hypothetical protein